ncbi:hypothetical protein MJO28_011255, partial [Puccinia striiformis f. sp. tritici]
KLESRPASSDLEDSKLPDHWLRKVGLGSTGAANDLHMRDALQGNLIIKPRCISKTNPNVEMLARGAGEGVKKIDCSTAHRSDIVKSNVKLEVSNSVRTCSAKTNFQSYTSFSRQRKKLYSTLIQEKPAGDMRPRALSKLDAHCPRMA